MSINDGEYRDFAQRVIDTLKKNGFPDKQVSLGLDGLYEAASNKGISFNRVLDTLRSIQIDHKKTSDRIIFFPHKAPVVDTTLLSTLGLDPSLFSNLDMSVFDGVEPPTNVSQATQMAARMMAKMSPEQIAAIRDAFGNMKQSDLESVMEQARTVSDMLSDKE